MKLDKIEFQKWSKWITKIKDDLQGVLEAQ